MTWVRAREQASERSERLGLLSGADGPVRAPRHRLWSGSGCSAPGPYEAASPGWRWHAPDADRFGSLAGLDLASALALLGCLSGHSECVADLGPGGSVAACCGCPEISRVGQGVLGVSHGCECVQGSLRAVQSPGEGSGRLCGAAASGAAFWGGHVNGYCTAAPTTFVPSRQVCLTAGIWDTEFLNSVERVSHRPISTFAGFDSADNRKEKTPTRRQSLGVVDASGMTDDDGSSLR